MSGFDLALDEARRALDQQSDDLNQLRTRATTLVSVGGLAAAFLGGLAGLDDAKRLSTAASVGAGSFVVVVICAFVIQWPRTFTFTQRSAAIVDWAEDGANLDDMQRDLALHMQKHYDANRQHFRWFTRFYCAGLVFLAIEIGALLFNLKGG